MAKDIESRIAAQKAKMERAAQALNKLQQQAKGVARKRETRQKIIVGGLVLAYMEKDPSFADRIRDMIAGGVIRPHDREAVGELLAGRTALSYTIGRARCGRSSACHFSVARQ